MHRDYPVLTGVGIGVAVAYVFSKNLVTFGSMPVSTTASLASAVLTFLVTKSVLAAAVSGATASGVVASSP